MKLSLVLLSVLFELSQCRDFYAGMFKNNDFLVAQDTVYKEKSAFGYTTAKYGRVFHCPITYFRISDRLGYGRPPSVIVTRGGLQKKYITLRLTSPYNTPIAVNIYVGCTNNLKPKVVQTTTKNDPEEVNGTTTTENPNAEDNGATDENNPAPEEADKNDQTPADAAEN